MVESSFDHKTFRLNRETQSARYNNKRSLYALAHYTLVSGTHMHIRVKTVGKILSNFGSVFSYFFIVFILFGKYDNQYENGIYCHGNRSEYGWASIPSIFELGRKIR
jgi:hypothetical protein